MAWEIIVLQDPKWLDSRVEAFLCTFLEVLQKMSAEEFQVEIFWEFFPLFLMQLRCAKSVWEQLIKSEVGWGHNYFYWERVSY